MNSHDDFVIPEFVIYVSDALPAGTWFLLPSNVRTPSLIQPKAILASTEDVQFFKDMHEAGAIRAELRTDKKPNREPMLGGQREDNTPMLGSNNGKGK